MNRSFRGLLIASILFAASAAFGQGTPTKISDLPTATTPLSGTESVAVVQGGVTKKAPASAFTGTAANPSATIGATAVNGSASTYMRSDAAPAMPATLPALDGSNLTSLNPSNLSAVVPTSKGGTGADNSASTGIPVYSAGTATVTSTTGTGAPVRATSPTLVTPNLGTPSAVTLTNATGLPIGGISATGSASSTTYLRGDGSWATPAGGSATPGGSTTQLQYNNAGAFGGISGATSNGTSVTLTSPTLVTPALGTPASGTLTNATGLPPSTGLSATGTPSSSTYLRGDNTWATPSGGGNASFGTATGNTSGNAVVMSNTTTGIADAGYAPAAQGSVTSTGSNASITATIFNPGAAITATAAINLTFNATSGLSRNGSLFVTATNGIVTITPNGADTVCVAGSACLSAGSATTIASGNGALIASPTSGRLEVQPIAGSSGGGSGCSPGVTSALLKGDGAGGCTNTNLTGDVTTSGGQATTLATVNSNTGACGDSTHVCQVTLDGKGRATAATAVAISGGGGGLSVIPNYATGCILTFNSTTALDIGACTVSDSTNATWIVLPAFTKTTATWASGTGNGGMGNGLTVASATGYFVCAWYNGGTPDVSLDTSVTCANKPTGITGSTYRLIGWIKTCFVTNSSSGPCTSASTNIAPFKEATVPGGKRFYWNPPATIGGPVDASGDTRTANTQSLITLSVPIGIRVRANVKVVMAAACVATKVSDPLEPIPTTGVTASISNSGTSGDWFGTNAVFQRTGFDVNTNTSGQIGVTANTTCSTGNGVQTTGFEWDQGRNG